MKRCKMIPVNQSVQSDSVKTKNECCNIQANMSRGLLFTKVVDARRKIRIKPLKESNLVVTRVLFGLYDMTFVKKLLKAHQFIYFFSIFILNFN